MNTAAVHALLRVDRYAVYTYLAAQIALALLSKRRMKVGHRGGRAHGGHNQPSAIGGYKVE